MQTLVTPAALARELGVAEPTFRRWLARGLIPQPEASLGRFRAFTQGQVEPIREWRARVLAERATGSLPPDVLGVLNQRPVE